MQRELNARLWESVQAWMEEQEAGRQPLCAQNPRLPKRGLFSLSLQKRGAVDSGEVSNYQAHLNPNGRWVSRTHRAENYLTKLFPDLYICITVHTCPYTQAHSK